MNRRKDKADRASRRSTGAGRRGVGGFTVLEMMVTVVVLAMMITAFSTIILQCNRVVSKAQRLMRGNSKIAAIAHMLRRDVHRATKGGIMAITQSGSGSPILFLTTGEPMTTTRTATECLGSYVIYGMRPNGADPALSVLWRPEYGFPPDGATTPVDTVARTLSEVQALPSTAASGEVSSVLSLSAGALYYPPANLSQIDNLWQVLAAGCSDMVIMWTDGTATNGQMNWHDSSVGAVWTSDDAGSWPKAVLVRFRLTDPPVMTGQVYEIICELSP